MSPGSSARAGSLSGFVVPSTPSESGDLQVCRGLSYLPDSMETVGAKVEAEAWLCTFCDLLRLRCGYEWHDLRSVCGLLEPLQGTVEGVAVEALDQRRV